MKSAKPLLELDRRWIFLVLAVVVTIPLLRPVNMKLDITAESRQYYQALDSVPENSVVLLSFDFGPAAAAELQPLAENTIRHAFRKNLKVVTLALWPDGALLSRQYIQHIGDEMGKNYGQDYATLGYYSGVIAGINQMGADLKAAFPEDAAGTPTSQVPLLKNVHNYEDFALVIALTAGDSADWWIALANGRYHARLALGCTAVMASDYYAYLQTRQIVGLIGGLKAAGEYEKLAFGDNTPETYRKMDAQSAAHVAIVLFVLLGNVAFFVARRREKAAALAMGG